MFEISEYICTLTSWFSPKSVAKARAGMQDENNEAVTVATEMKKFLPLIRIPTMTVHEFRTVVDASRVLPAEDVNQFYRFFTTTDAEER